MGTGWSGSPLSGVTVTSPSCGGHPAAPRNHCSFPGKQSFRQNHGMESVSRGSPPKHCTPSLGVTAQRARSTWPWCLDLKESQTQRPRPPCLQRDRHQKQHAGLGRKIQAEAAPFPACPLPVNFCSTAARPPAGQEQGGRPPSSFGAERKGEAASKHAAHHTHSLPPLLSKQGSGRLVLPDLVALNTANTHTEKITIMSHNQEVRVAGK